jgi:ferrochelatase
MKALLLAAYGGPSSMDRVDDFYRAIYRGQPPAAETLAAGRSLFRALGVCDPLHAITFRQAAALERRLKRMTGEEIRVYVGMKHGEPLIGQAARSIVRDGAEAVAVMPMSMLYSKTGAGLYIRQVRETLAAMRSSLPVLELIRWSLDASFIDVLADRARRAWHWLPIAARDTAKMVFTAHSKPGKAQANRDYIEQFQALARNVALRAGIPRWRLAYRSGGPPPQTWLGPDILDVIREEGFNGTGGIAVCELLSLTDNAEALRDIGADAQRAAHSLGLEFVRAECLNDADDAMEVLARIAAERMRQAGWFKEAGADRTGCGRKR